MKDPHAPSGGLGAACFAAAGGAPLAFVPLLLSSGGGMGIVFLIPVMIVGFPIALLHVVFLALPAYVLVDRFWRLTWWNSSLAGLLIGGIPAALLSLPWQTSFEWQMPGMAAACGAVGGFLFWLVLRPKQTDETELRETFD